MSVVGVFEDQVSCTCRRDLSDATLAPDCSDYQLAIVSAWRSLLSFILQKCGRLLVLVISITPVLNGRRCRTEESSIAKRSRVIRNTYSFCPEESGSGSIGLATRRQPALIMSASTI